MGIPSYFSHIIKKHPAIIMSLIHLARVDNLYLDSNSIIYDAVRKTPKSHDESRRAYEIRIYHAVCATIDEYINKIRPRERVVIAFDGVAPLAKLRQQRERRYRSWFIRKFCSGSTSIAPTDWDTTAITPGTEFMTGLNEFVSDYYRRRAGDVSRDPTSTSTSTPTPTPALWKPRAFMVSGSNIPGEGEHKLFEYIRNNTKYHEGQTTVIYGLDADLIVLSLNHLRFAPSIFLAREAPHFAKELEGLTVADSVSPTSVAPDTLFCLDISALGDELVNDICSTESASTRLKHDKKTAKLMDYTLLTFFLGNDFMPHFPTLNIRTTGIDTLLDNYRMIYRVDETICDNGGVIHWKQLRRLVDALAAEESDNFKREMTTRARMEMALWKKDEMETRMLIQQERNNRRVAGTSSASTTASTSIPSSPASKVGTPEFREERLNRIPLMYRMVETYIDPSSYGWERRYYESLFQTAPRKEFLTHLCRQYMEGLEWTLAYYSVGCKNLRWKYNYHYAPLLRDLVPMIPHFDTTMVSPNYIPLDATTQLACVLPKPALGLLPDDTRSRLLEKLPDFYRDNCEFQWAFCKYFWESHPLLPEVDIETIEEILAERV